MPALGFKKHLAPLVESRVKRQTIRQVWRNPIKAGDTLYLYTGLRTKQCRKLGESICTSVREIQIQPPGGLIVGEGIYLYGKGKLSLSESLELAAKDGFKNIHDFISFFRDQYGLPFEGVLIEWE